VNRKQLYLVGVNDDLLGDVVVEIGVEWLVHFRIIEAYYCATISLLTIYHTI